MILFFEIKLRYFKKATKICTIFQLEFDAFKWCKIKSGRMGHIFVASQNIWTIFNKRPKDCIGNIFAAFESEGIVGFVFSMYKTLIFIVYCLLLFQLNWMASWVASCNRSGFSDLCSGHLLPLGLTLPSTKTCYSSFEKSETQNQK